MRISSRVPLKQLTTMRVGGPAQYLFTVYSTGELAAVVRFAKAHNLPWLVLGGGSNIVFPDEGYHGVIIRIGIRSATYTKEDADVHATVGAGKQWDEFVRETIAYGYYGLENLSGIPGNVGAAPIQNIGAYGKEVSEHVTDVTVFDTETERVRVFPPEACQFTYRDSFFKTPEGKRFIVISATFQLAQNGQCNISYRDLAQYFADSEAEEITPQAVRDAVIAIRASKLPDMRTWGTCGSFFTNPIVPLTKAQELAERHPGLSYTMHTPEAAKLSAAWLIEHIGGWKGVRYGHVGVYEHHALTLVNDNGDAAHVHTLSQHIKDDLYTKTGVMLQEEPHIVM